MFHPQPEKCDAIKDECLRLLTDDTYLAGIPADQRHAFLTGAVRQTLPRMSLSERRQVIVKLISRSEMLEAISPYAMSKLMQAVYMLPGDEHLEFTRGLGGSEPSTA